MRNSLLLRLSQEGGDACEWVLMGAEGRAAGTVQSGTLAEAAAAASGLRVSVLAPGGDCLLTTASIPGSNRQKLLRALPYALEDQLTVDVEDLHFALGPSLGEDRYAVVVIAIERMEAILEACREAEMDVGRIIPEQLAIPCPDSGTCVVIDNDVALVRTGRHAGYAIDTGNLGLLLSRQQPQEEESAPELRIYNAAGTDLPDLGAAAGTAVVEEYHGSTLGLLAEGSASPGIDLLQGPYSRSQEWGKLWRPWRATAALLLAGFVVSHAVMGVEYYRLSKEREALGNRIEETYRQAFPAAKRVVNPRAQMQQQLDQLLRLQGGGDGFMTLLARAGDVLRTNKAIEISGASFRAGRLDVDLTANNLQVLDELKQTLAGKGLVVEIQSATTDASQRVKSRLRIHGGSA
jgi:general secretion pathway protein L